MLKVILAKIHALASILPLAIAATLLTLAPAAYADGHSDRNGPFWFNEHGWTRLHNLAFLSDNDDPAAELARAQDLLSRGANPNVIIDNGWTPLMIAASTNFVKMASLLIANGANVNARDNTGNTAMDWAIYMGHTKMQALLRAHDGKCNKRC